MGALAKHHSGSRKSRLTVMFLVASSPHKKNTVASSPRAGGEYSGIYSIEHFG